MTRNNTLTEKYNWKYIRKVLLLLWLTCLLLLVLVTDFYGLIFFLLAKEMSESTSRVPCTYPTNSCGRNGVEKKRKEKKRKRKKRISALDDAFLRFCFTSFRLFYSSPLDSTCLLLKLFSLVSLCRYTFLPYFDYFSTIFFFSFFLV